MANRRPPRPDQRGQGPSRRPNAGRPGRQNNASSHQKAASHRRKPADTQARQESIAGEERLQKILAHAGIGSRRACEEVIRQGRVTVDGKVVKELGTKIDSRKSRVEVDGQPIHLERMVYYAVSKPKGYVSTNNDPAGRPRVVDLLPEIPQRVYTVGRLDEMSTGLILLTNDGELANKLAHPRFGVEKLYRVIVAGTPSREVLDKLVEGVWLAEGKVRARNVRVVGKKGQATVLEMVLAEGKNREVRRMLAKFGHKVMTLTRIAVGPITLKGLAFGDYRPLNQGEIDLLRRVAAGESVPSARHSARGPRGGAGARRQTRSGPGARPRPDSGSPRPGLGQGQGQGQGEPGPFRRREGAGPGPYGGPRRPMGQGPGQGRPPREDRSRGAVYRSPSGRIEYEQNFEEGRPTRPPGIPPSQRRGAPSGPRPGMGGGEGGRPVRPQGPPPSQRRAGPGSGSGYGQGSYSNSGAGAGDRPGGVSRPQRRPDGAGPQRREGAYGGPQGPGTRSGSGGGAGGPQRRPGGSGGGSGPQRREGTHGGPPRRPGRPGPSGGGGGRPERGPQEIEPRPRRIIGIDGGARELRETTPKPKPKPHLIKKRPPRSLLGLKRGRPKGPQE